jgi:predicted Zn-dependent protease
VLLLGGFVAGSAAKRATVQRRRLAREMAAPEAAFHSEPTVDGAVRRAFIPKGREQSAPPEELRRRVDNLKSGTYIDDVIVAQDSALYRWHDPSAGDVRVWIEPTSAGAGWEPSYPELARGAFWEWSDAGFPLRFAFVDDSTSAEISIRWRERFAAEDGQRIGVTERIQTSQYWIASARIQVANHDSAGRLLPPRIVAGILRHEIGHALGLNHANDATSVMYREAATSTIAASDRSTLRLLYLVPPGSLR